jgi:3-oxoacyl-[acyl-carrier protein] reductase
MSQDLDFSNKKVLVVGGSSGIGNGIARAFLARGASVHVWGTRASAAAYAHEEGSDLSGLEYSQVDVADPGQIEAFSRQMAALNVLVLSQGTVIYARGEFTPDGFRRVVDLNLNSVMNCCLKFFALLRASQGAVIIVSSTAAFQSTRGNPAYSASKSALTGLTRTLGEAWASDHIRVNAIAPGFVDTKLTKVTVENPQRLARALRAIPLGRLGSPDDMAGAALFLASPLAGYIVGQTIIVDGGLTLG